VQIVECADIDAALRTPSRSSALILGAQQTRCRGIPRVPV